MVIFLLMLIAAVLILGAAAIRNAFLAILGALVLAGLMAYIGISTGLSFWPVAVIIASPVILLLAWTAFENIGYSDYDVESMT